MSRKRWFFSGLIVFHLLAVVLPPLAFQTASSGSQSSLVQALLRPVAGYGQFLHLDRGYAFFAPDPGPSRLIQVAVVAPDGSVTESMYPDLQSQWPRLLYHRHFMLTEFLSNIYQPPGPPDEMFQSDPLGAEMWQRARGRYEFVRKSMVDHLRSVHDGRPVAIRRVEHAIPALPEYNAEPIPLSDPRLYNILLDQPVFSDQMAPADGSPPAEATPAEESEVIPPPQNRSSVVPLEVTVMTPLLSPVEERPP